MWKIDIENQLHRESKSKRRNPAYFDRTTNQKITSFVKECIDIYNASHRKAGQWTFAEMMYFLKFVWQKETKDYLDRKHLANMLG